MSDELRLHIPNMELWDEQKEEFFDFDECEVLLEHSLYTVAQWEAKFKIPFVSDKKKTKPQTVEYIKIMDRHSAIPNEEYEYIPDSCVRLIREFIDDSRTASWISESARDSSKGKNSGEQITAETIYWQMINLNIPLECEHWHFNRLMALIRFCNEKNQPKKKWTQKQTAEYYAQLNAKRRAEMNSKG